MNLRPSNVTFKVCEGEGDEEERWCSTDGTQDPKLA